MTYRYVILSHFNEIVNQSIRKSLEQYNEADWLNALERLYTDKELYHRLAENGYKTYMRAHRTECCARNFTTLIEKRLYYDS